MNEKLRCVMVGLGGRGQYLLQQVLEHPDCEVVALAEPNPDLLAKAREIAGIAESQCYTDLEAALSLPDAEATVINTPPQAHVENLEASFAHGLHALIAKPLTRDFRDAKKVVELAESKKLALVVDQQGRFATTERTIAGWIEGKKFGALGFGTYTFHRNRPLMHHSTDENPFLWEQGVHCFNSLLAMLGRRALTVRSYQTRPEWTKYNGPTVSAGVIEFEGNDEIAPIVPIQFFGSYSSQVRSTEVQFEFEKGAVRVEEGYRTGFFVAEPGESYTPVEVEAKTRALEQYNLDNFYRAVREGVRVPNDGRDNLRTLALVDAFIQSSQSGRQTEVEDVG